MPKWVKAVVVMFGVAVLLLLFAGFLAARMVSGVSAGVQRGVERAEREGRRNGQHGTHDNCLIQASRNVVRCRGLACAVQARAFVGGCLDAVPGDAASFCAKIPQASDEDAVQDWARDVCISRGGGATNACAVALSVTAEFCASR